MYSRSGFGDLPPAISFQKTSGPGDVGTFRVGESWSIRVTGPANQPIIFSGGQHGKIGPPAQLGSTDASGVWIMSGTMTADQIGTWNETWTIGGIPLGTLNFQVVAATPDVQQHPILKLPSPGYLPPTVINTLTDSSGLNVAGYNLPWWMIAAAVGGLFFLGGRHR